MTEYFGESLFRKYKCEGKQVQNIYLEKIGSIGIEKFFIPSASWLKLPQKKIKILL